MLTRVADDYSAAALPGIGSARIQPVAWLRRLCLGPLSLLPG